MSKAIPKPGALVGHYMFLRQEWMAMVLRHNMVFDDNSQLFVRMLPGVTLQNYFEDQKRVGWVYTKWLWLIQEKIEC